jgi:anaerobic magnesium-protoporphyrin IX monomethyl ester cyclase
MHILFAYPFFLKDSALEQNWNTPYFPLGLLYLAGAAREAGHTVSLFDGTFAGCSKDFYAVFEQAQPDVVCITSLITIRNRALEIGQYAIEHGAHVIYGGPDTKVVPGVYAATGGDVVLGEGERTLIELLDSYAGQGERSAVHGIAYCEDEVLHTTPPRSAIRDLSQLPTPARDLLDFDPYFELWHASHGYTSMTVAATRGCDCEQACEDCVPSNFGVQIRFRSPEDVVAEMQGIETRYSVDRFRLVDDLEALGRDWLVALGEAMQAAGVQTPYEGLKPLHFDDLPMYQPQKDMCAERTVWLPGVDTNPDALDMDTIQRRWKHGTLLDDETLAPTCKNCS